MKRRDWTMNTVTGRSNSSAEFEAIAGVVESLIVSSAHDLIAGNSYGVARLIVAQLAHKYGMAPPKRRNR